MDRGTMYFGGIMVIVIFVVSFINAWMAQFLPSELASQIGGGLMIGLMIAGIGGLEAYYILHTSSYAHYQMIIRPYNEIVELFVDDRDVKSEKTGRNLYSSVFPLVFPRKIKSYGNAKIRQIEILHEYEKGQRFDLRPGRASLDDYDFNHPQTEIIEVVQLPGYSTGLDRSEVIPRYKLLSARNDYERTFMPLAQIVPLISGGQKAVIDLPKIAELENQITKLENNLAMSRAAEKKFHQQSISREEYVDHQRSETTGLLNAKGGIPLFAIEYVLTLLAAMHDLDNVAKYLQGSKFERWGKWLIIGLIAGGLIIYLQLNPQIFEGFYNYFSDATHQITILAMLAVVGLAVYLIMRRRRS